MEYGIRDLEEGDIPYYFTEMNSHSLFTSRKEEIDEYFSLSLTDCFRFRMEKREDWIAADKSRLSVW